MKRYTFIPIVFIILSSCADKMKMSDATGTFEATEITVSGETSGKIISLDIKQGDLLYTDQIVGLIDTTQMSLQRDIILRSITALERSIINIDIQLAPMYEQLENLKHEKARVENLFNANTATGKQLDDIKYSVKILEKQIESQREQLSLTNNSANSQIDVRRAELAQLEDMINRAYIKSPITGTVLTKYAESGELTAAGKPLFKIANLQDINLKAYITAEQLFKIKIGDKVKVVCTYGDEQREYPGSVIWISDQSEFTPKNILTADERANLVYAVKVAVVNDGYLKTGMYGELCFQ